MSKDKTVEGYLYGVPITMTFKGKPEEETYPCELCGKIVEGPDSGYCDACNTKVNLDEAIDDVLSKIERHVRMFGVDRKALLEGVNKGQSND